MISLRLVAENMALRARSSRMALRHIVGIPNLGKRCTSVKFDGDVCEQCEGRPHNASNNYNQCRRDLG